MSENQIDNPEPTIITSFQYSIVDFIAGKSITVRVLLFDQNNHPVEFKNIVLEGIYYKGWANDDSYLMNYVASTLGLIIIESVHVTNTVSVVDAPILYTNLCMDTNNNIKLPDGFTKNEFNIILDKTNNPVKFAILRYYPNGMPDVTSQLLIGPDDNPILPPNIREPSGSLITEMGESLVIVYNNVITYNKIELIENETNNDEL